MCCWPLHLVLHSWFPLTTSLSTPASAVSSKTLQFYLVAVLQPGLTWMCMGCHCWVVHTYIFVSIYLYKPLGQPIMGWCNGSWSCTEPELRYCGCYSMREGGGMRMGSNIAKRGEVSGWTQLDRWLLATSATNCMSLQCMQWGTWVSNKCDDNKIVLVKKLKLRSNAVLLHLC